VSPFWIVSDCVLAFFLSSTGGDVMFGVALPVNAFETNAVTPSAEPIHFETGYTRNWYSNPINLKYRKDQKDYLTDNGFQALIDVHEFKQGEVSMKVVDKHIITVTAKHAPRRDDFGTIERGFVRRYDVPLKHFDVENATSSLSNEGILTITAMPRLKDNEKSIPIMSGPSAALTINPEIKKAYKALLKK